MQSWTILAAKHAALTPGIALGAIPAAGWDSLDGVAVGVLLAGIGFAAVSREACPGLPAAAGWRPGRAGGWRQPAFRTPLQVQAAGRRRADRHAQRRCGQAESGSGRRPGRARVQPRRPSRGSMARRPGAVTTSTRSRRAASLTRTRTRTSRERAVPDLRGARAGRSWVRSRARPSRAGPAFRVSTVSAAPWPWLTSSATVDGEQLWPLGSNRPGPGRSSRRTRARARGERPRREGRCCARCRRRPSGAVTPSSGSWRRPSSTWAWCARSAPGSRARRIRRTNLTRRPPAATPRQRNETAQPAVGPGRPVPTLMMPRGTERFGGSRDRPHYPRSTRWEGAPARLRPPPLAPVRSKRSRRAKTTLTPTMPAAVAAILIGRSVTQAGSAAILTATAATAAMGAGPSRGTRRRPPAWQPPLFVAWLWVAQQVYSLIFAHG